MVFAAKNNLLNIDDICKQLGVDHTDHGGAKESAQVRSMVAEGRLKERHIVLSNSRFTSRQYEYALCRARDR